MMKQLDVLQSFMRMMNIHDKCWKKGLCKHFKECFNAKTVNSMQS